MQSEITIEPGQAEIVIRVPLPVAVERLRSSIFATRDLAIWVPRRRIVDVIGKVKQQEIDAEQSARRKS